MCGEAAGDSVMAPLLVGMGLDEFSMSATSVLRVRSLMKRLDTTQLTDLVETAVNVNTSNEENQKLVEDFMQNL